jgi:hypothetical protein
VITSQGIFARKCVQYHIIKANLPDNQWLALHSSIKEDLFMPKIKVYQFTKYDIIQGKNVASKRMATLEAIKIFEGMPLMDTAKEVDSAEVDENGRYPKTYKVIYSTKAFPITNIQKIGKQKEVEFSSFKAATSAPFPTDEEYVFTSIQVVDGYFTRSFDNDEWNFQEYLSQQLNPPDPRSSGR